MSKLSDEKLTKLRALDSQGGFWYITKQNLVFRDLCFMAKILEAWNDRKEENYESFFYKHNTLPEYGTLDSSVAHRATKNCEYIGLTKPSDKYSAQNLTPFYFALKNLCNGDFNKLSAYPQIIDKQLERMFIDSRTNKTYTTNFQICPFMFLFKVLLLIGDITKSYKISTQEFKLFVATAQNWQEYFEVVESILRYREDATYKAECDKNNGKVSDVRYQVLAQNHSQLSTNGNNIEIKDSEIRNIRRKVAEYELSDKIQSPEDIFKPILSNKVFSLAQDNTSYLPYLTALRTKPFMLLAGISGTGKSRIVRKLAQATNPKKYANEEDRWKDNRPENFELIQVKPNWHNSMDVVGYMSNIPTPHYVFTDFVRFIVKAWQHKDTPYFLCLDEMNLAPVEEYFAEFLSAIESRAMDENGEYITDPIIAPFKEFAQDVREDMLKQLLGEAHHTEANPLAIQFTEKGLTLPPNLMVMGTVNMDETTFSFSRKVLDRAMSVEMNEVKYDDFLSGQTELMPLLTEWNDKLVNRPQKACEVQEQIDSQKVIDYLKAVNELLDSTPFKLGYRAANEAILYVSACQDFAKDGFNIEKALDEFTLMKILSRIEGDDSRLAIDEKDERLLKAGIKGNALDDGEQSLNLLNCLRAIVRKHIGQDTETEKKINRMYNTLLREHFVSYWG